MKTKEELHDELDALEPKVGTALVVHALIDLHAVKELACQYEECKYDDRHFVVRDRPHQPRGLTIDHIVPQDDGGSHRPENLCLMHFGCNSARGGKYAWTKAGRREAHRKQMELLWNDEEYRDKMVGRVMSQEELERRTRSRPRGDDHWTRKT